MNVASAPDEIEVVARKSLQGRVRSLLIARQTDSLLSDEVEGLALTLGGIRGDRHYGFTRKSGSREPWYPRGSEIRNGREVTIVSVEEIAEIANGMGLAALPAGWIGANLVVQGVPRLTFLPPGTRIFFEGEAVLTVEGVNNPCRYAGQAIARQTGRTDLELLFPKVAAGLRGVVASVERPGTVSSGSQLTVRIPDQHIYR
jgi:hypothetical protein